MIKYIENTDKDAGPWIICAAAIKGHEKIWKCSFKHDLLPYNSIDEEGTELPKPMLINNRHVLIEPSHKEWYVIPSGTPFIPLEGEMLNG